MTNLWVYDWGNGDAIYILDPSTGATLGSRSVEPLGWMSPEGLVSDGTSIWASDGSSGFSDSLYLLDTIDPMSVIRTIPSPSAAAGPLAYDGTSLWMGSVDLTTFDPMIYKVDPSDGTVLASFYPAISGVLGLTWDGTSLWAVDGGGVAGVHEIDPSDGSVLSSWTTPSAHGDHRDAAWDTANDEILIADRNINNTIYRYSSSGATVDTLDPGISGFLADAMTFHGEAEEPTKSSQPRLRLNQRVI